ncbi:MAG TPA: DUF4337 family protein [Anaeromyxobacteraceae bacterium]|nr:DUF4337 family protein [Anaeromyxobacteraceae bacterium]HET9595663.1 DUF4337 family protein [Anaeromyxobacteraceae bacterium]
MTLPQARPAAVPADKLAEAVERGRGLLEGARLTAALAVLAAVCSGQYAQAFSQTILDQTEASDAWNYYQAKSIKRSLSQGEADLAAALSGGAAATPALAQMQARSAERAARYDKELADIKANAEVVEARKRQHQRKGERFQYAFVVLQAGVVLSTLASRRRAIAWVALVAGLAGLAVAADAYLLWI